MFKIVCEVFNSVSFAVVIDKAALLMATVVTDVLAKGVATLSSRTERVDPPYEVGEEINGKIIFSFNSRPGQ